MEIGMMFARAAGDHDLGLAEIQQALRLHEGENAGRAGRDGGDRRAAHAEIDCDLARGHVRRHRRHSERADTRGALLKVDLLAVRDDIDAAAAGVHHDREVVPVRVVNREARVLDRPPGSRHGELREAGGAFRGLHLHVARGVPVFHLGGDAAVLVARVEQRDWLDAGDACGQVRPELGHGVADGSDAPQPGDDGPHH